MNRWVLPRAHAFLLLLLPGAGRTDDRWEAGCLATGFTSDSALSPLPR